MEASFTSTFLFVSIVSIKTFSLLSSSKSSTCLQKIFHEKSNQIWIDYLCNFLSLSNLYFIFVILSSDIRVVLNSHFDWSVFFAQIWIDTMRSHLFVCFFWNIKFSYIKINYKQIRTDLVKNFDLDNGTSENKFSHPYISYMVQERLQGEKEFHSKNYLLEISRSYAKMHLKSAPQKLNFAIAKAISKSCTIYYSCKCSCTSPHSYADLFSIKNFSCEATNIMFSKNYWKLGKLNARF